MSESKPIIVVAGATGRQGGSVVNFLLQDGTFQVRAITRNIESDKAKELSAKGAEVVHAHFDDPQSIRTAFKDAYGVFAMTNFWDPSGVREEGEVRQGKNLVDAAKAENIKHLVWSLYTGVYQEEFGTGGFFPLTKNKDGSYEANWPILASDGPLWMYTVNDTGAWVLEALKKPDEWINKDMRILTYIHTPREFVKVLEEESGKKVNNHEVTFEDFNKIKDVPEQHELWANMSNFYNGLLEPRDPALARRIYPQTKTMKEWVKANMDVLLPQ